MAEAAYVQPDTLLLFDGKWRGGSADRTLSITDPGTDEIIETVAKAERADLDAALMASAQGFEIWSATSTFERSKVMRRAGKLLRERLEAHDDGTGPCSGTRI